MAAKWTRDRRYGWLRAVALTALAACQSRALTNPTGGVGTGATGSAGVTGSAGADVAVTGGAGVTGAGGTVDGSIGGVDAGDRCRIANDRATITVHTTNGTVMSCDTASADAGTGTSPTVFMGLITGVEAGALVLDSGVRIEVAAAGLDLTAIPKVAARVEVAFRSFFGCTQTLEVTVGPPPDGAAPLFPEGKLLLAVVDGFNGAYAERSYSVDSVPLGCESAKGCGSPKPDEYAFDFIPSIGDATPTRVAMGQTVAWSVSGGRFKVRNLRSFQTMVCDDYLNFAFTIVATSP